MSGFQEAKLFLVHVTALSKDTLHVYVGLLVFLGVALFLARSLKSVWPLLAVALVAAGGELLDMRDVLLADRPILWRESVHDFLNTLFWPTVIFLLARTGLLEKRLPPSA